MAWYDIIFNTQKKMNLKGKSLYELSQNQTWREKWCVRHRDFGADIPLTSPLGRAILSSPIDGPKLVESTYAHREGKSKPFELSDETLSLISKI